MSSTPRMPTWLVVYIAIGTLISLMAITGWVIEGQWAKAMFQGCLLFVIAVGVPLVWRSSGTG